MLIFKADNVYKELNDNLLIIGIGIGVVSTMFILSCIIYIIL